MARVLKIDDTFNGYFSIGREFPKNKANYIEFSKLDKRIVLVNGIKNAKTITRFNDTNKNFHLFVIFSPMGIVSKSYSDEKFQFNIDWMIYGFMEI